MARCPRVRDRCKTDSPPLHTVADQRGSACHFWEEVLSDNSG
jgi:hypothetical protein